jgi:hypothetical protein
MIAAGLALSFAGFAGGTAAVAAQGDKEIELTGCVVRDEGGDGFLLTNVPRTPTFQAAGADPVAPGPVGTSGAAATIFYWFDDDDELEEHVGHQVQVRGELEGDVKEGAIKLERKDNWTEITIESDGRDLKARVPQSLFVVRPAGATRSSDADVDVLVRKVDAKDVKMLAASCEP